MKQRLRTPLSLIVALLLLAPAPLRAQNAEPCSEVSPRLIENRLSRLSGGGYCLGSEVAATLRLSAERVCYHTGLPETQQAATPPEPPTRTIRIRRGTEVQEVKLVSRSPLRDIVDIRDSLDTVFLDVTATVCLGPERVRLTSGSWEIRGRDAGTVFSAKGFLPSSRIEAGYATDVEGLAISFDLPEVRLNEDPLPRRIAGALTVPIR